MRNYIIGLGVFFAAGIVAACVGFYAEMSLPVKMEKIPMAEAPQPAFTQKDRGIFSAWDLKGKPVGRPVKTNAAPFSKIFLTNQSLTLKRQLIFSFFREVSPTSVTVD